jgi:hypothetical protein
MKCSKLSEQTKETKLQWLQNPSQIKGDDLNNVRGEISWTFRNKRREYLEEKLISLKRKVRTKINRTGEMRNA